MLTKNKPVTLASLGSELRRVFRTSIPEIVAEFKRRAIRDVFIELPPETPVGSPATAERRATSPHPGKMRASWLPSVGTAEYAGLADRPSYGIPGANMVDAILSEIGAGDEAFVTNDAMTDGAAASYAPLIYGGRRTVGGRTVGSLQAPEGLAPVVRRALSRSEQFFTKALKRGLDLFGWLVLLGGIGGVA
jgi:hypothetical protein